MVGLGKALGVVEAIGDADGDVPGVVGGVGAVGVPVGFGDGDGVGVARISCHCQSSPVYPPISFKSAAHRSCILGRSGGPGWLSALPGNTR